MFIDERLNKEINELRHEEKMDLLDQLENRDSQFSVTGDNNIANVIVDGLCNIIATAGIKLRIFKIDNR